MAHLPHGTVTFAFTDIEGSTRLLKQLGDGYGEILSAHRRLVRNAFTAHDGVEIDTQGDAFFFAFTRAGDAIAAAASVQRDHAAYEWPPGAAVRTRIGLHTGEPTIGEEGYLGLDVVRAARLCGVCEGGHVLLSETTRALMGSRLPDGVSVFPVGERHLKDMDEPERVYELEIEGVDLPPTTQTDEVAVRRIPAPPAPAPPVPAAKNGRRWLSWKDRKAERERQRDERRSQYEERAEEFAQRTVEGVLGFVDRKLGDLAQRAADRESEDTQVEISDMSVRADELARRAQAGIRQALEERMRKHHDD
ncbi:MAG: adenylate/guanylate cyclase domain-containing protein [bacterium]|nr:adenylate/guanylate cyclase domain-containing protein [bacterium]